MANIIRPDLVKFMGKEHEDTEQLWNMLQWNRTMALTLLRRRALAESFFALAKADEENAGYWEEIAKECNRLYEDLWNNETEDSTAFEELRKVLKRPMPEKPPTAEELREKEVSSLQGKGMNEILRRIKNALDTDEWKRLFEEDTEEEEAYSKLKRIYSEKCTESFLKALDKKYQSYMNHDVLGGGAKEVSGYVQTWCLNAAAENLVKKEEGYPLNEIFWAEPCDVERANLLETSYFYTAAELLECWDESMKQEPGSTLKNSYGYERCKPGLEREEKKLAALEEAYSRLKICRTRFADGTWFELWENSEPQSVERMAFFLLAAGKANVDRTDFDRIWKAESDMKYSEAEREEFGQWYWYYGKALARRVGEVKSCEKECQVGYFWIAESAAEAVRYILNELSKWKKMSRVTSESIKEYACPNSWKKSIYNDKKLLESCEEYLKKRQEDIDKMFCVKGPWSRMFERKENIDLLFDEKKKQGYYLATCKKQYYSGISAEKCFKVMKSVAMYHRYHKWCKIFRYVTFGPNRKKQKRYLRVLNSVDGISWAKSSCERFVEKRKRLHEKMRVECKKMRDKEKMFMESVPRSYTEIRCNGLFNYWEEQWDDLKRSYEEFIRMKTEWEKEESAHWEKELPEFEKTCEKYRKRMSDSFEDCYCLLELRKERGKKKWGLKRRIKTIKPSRKERPHKKTKGRSVRHFFGFSKLFRKRK